MKGGKFFTEVEMKASQRKPKPRGIPANESTDPVLLAKRYGADNPIVLMVQGLNNPALMAAIGAPADAKLDGKFLNEMAAYCNQKVRVGDEA